MNPLEFLFGNEIAGIPVSQRATHNYVVGQSGTGKSRAIESWVMQDVLAGRGVGVIDPHGDLFDHLLSRIAKIPSQANRVIVFNPLDPKWMIGFNPLKSIKGISPERQALHLTDVVIKVWKLKPEEAPRMVWLLANSFLALIELHLTLLDLPRWLLDADYRQGLLAKLNNQEVIRYFTDEYPASSSGMHQWATPVLNKLGNLIFDPDVRLMFLGQNTLDFRQILDGQKVLLVNLPKGILGEGLSSLLAAFIVAHLQKAALSRADTMIRTPFFLYLDEFQNYTTDNIQDILSESRKYGLSLILAHQYLDQLTTDLQSAVLNNAGTLTCFRVGFSDARTLAREIFPSPDFLSNPGIRMVIKRRGLLPIPALGNHRDSGGWERLALLLSNLKPREFWSRYRGANNPVKNFTLEMPAPRYSKELETSVKKLLDISGHNFGQLRTSIHADHDAFPIDNFSEHQPEVPFSSWSN